MTDGSSASKCFPIKAENDALRRPGEALFSHAEPAEWKEWWCSALDHYREAVAIAACAQSRPTGTTERAGRISLDVLEVNISLPAAGFHFLFTFDTPLPPVRSHGFVQADHLPSQHIAHVFVQRAGLWRVRRRGPSFQRSELGTRDRHPPLKFTGRAQRARR